MTWIIIVNESRKQSNETENVGKTKETCYLCTKPSKEVENKTLRF